MGWCIYGIEVEKVLEWYKVKEWFFSDGVMLGVGEEDFLLCVLEVMIMENFEMIKNDFWVFLCEIYVCKIGFGEIINIFIMSYKFRKKGVCDIIDNLYY